MSIIQLSKYDTSKALSIIDNRENLSKIIGIFFPISTDEGDTSMSSQLINSLFAPNTGIELDSQLSDLATLDNSSKVFAKAFAEDLSIKSSTSDEITNTLNALMSSKEYKIDQYHNILLGLQVAAASICIGILISQIVIYKLSQKKYIQNRIHGYTHDAAMARYNAIDISNMIAIAEDRATKEQLESKLPELSPEAGLSPTQIIVQ